MFVKEEGEGRPSPTSYIMVSPADPARNLRAYICVYLVNFGLLVWSTGLAPNPLIQSISEAKKDERTKR